MKESLYEKNFMHVHRPSDIYLKYIIDFCKESIFDMIDWLSYFLLISNFRFFSFSLKSIFLLAKILKEIIIYATYYFLNILHIFMTKKPQIKFLLKFL